MMSLLAVFFAVLCSSDESVVTVFPLRGASITEEDAGSIKGVRRVDARLAGR